MPGVSARVKPRAPAGNRQIESPAGATSLTDSPTADALPPPDASHAAQSTDRADGRANPSAQRACLERG